MDIIRKITMRIKRPFVKLWRIRHSGGHGVHSPFAFGLITEVINERTPYYIYKEIAAAEQKQSCSEEQQMECMKKNLCHKNTTHGCQRTHYYIYKEMVEEKKKFSIAADNISTGMKKHSNDKNKTLADLKKLSYDKSDAPTQPKDLSMAEEKICRCPKKHTRVNNKQWNYEPKRVKHLLFRLVNHAQPSNIMDAGSIAASSLYMRSAKPTAKYISASSASQLLPRGGGEVEFLYLHNYRDIEFMEKAFKLLVERANNRSVFVIEGIGYTAKMRRLWQQMLSHDKVRVSFDLYDVGIIYFDNEKLKQNYIVNF